MASEVSSAKMEVATDEGKKKPEFFSALPQELVLIIIDNLSQHELFTLMTVDRTVATMGQPILFQRDARAHNEHSVPEALMFAAIKSKTDHFLALKIVNMSLCKGGKINLNNVYKFESSRGFTGVARRPIATQASLLHFAVVFGSSKFVHHLTGTDMCARSSEFPNAPGFGLLDMAVEKFGLDLKELDKTKFGKYSGLLKQLDEETRSAYAIAATPLSYALQKDDWDMTEALLSFSVGRSLPYLLWHPNSRRVANTAITGPPMTLLHWAAMRTRINHETRERLPDERLIDTFRNHLGYQALEESPLLTAIEYGNAPFVQLLLQAGVDSNMLGASGRIPLVWACRRHRYHLPTRPERSKSILQCIKVLLEFQADPNIESGGETALENAMGGLSESLDDWDHARILVKTIVKSDLLDPHRVLDGGLTVTQRHAKNMFDLPDGSEALNFHHEVLGWMVRNGGLVDVQGQPTVAYTAFVDEKPALYEALRKAGAKMMREEKEQILVKMWAPGDQHERDRIEKALRFSLKEMQKIITTTEMAAQVYCAVADKDDDSTIRKMLNSVDWSDESQTMGRYAVEVIAGLPRKDKMRKIWMTEGFDASVGDSIGLLVLDKFEEDESYTPREALQDIKSLYTMGALPSKKYEGRSAYQRVKDLRRREVRSPSGGKRYQLMKEWFEYADEGLVSREDGEMERETQGGEEAEDGEDGVEDEDTEMKDDGGETTSRDIKMEEAEN